MTIRLDALGLVARDLATTATFYRRLGLDFPVPSPTEDHLETEAPNGLRVMLDSEKLIRQLRPDWTPPNSESMNLAFRCPTPAAVDSLYATLLADGYRSAKAPWDAFWGQRYAQIVDPDNRIVDLFAPLAETSDR